MTFMSRDHENAADPKGEIQFFKYPGALEKVKRGRSGLTKGKIWKLVQEALQKGGGHVVYGDASFNAAPYRGRLVRVVCVNSFGRNLCAYVVAPCGERAPKASRTRK